MADNLGRPIVVPEHKMAEFKALTQAPKYAKPTMLLTLVCLVSAATIITFALMGLIEYALAAVLLGMTYYWSFSTVHDSIHRSVSTNLKLNDAIGGTVVRCIVPYANVGLMRWAHMEHHRFTNDPRDPDHWSHGAWYTLPFRWKLIDLAYAVRLFSDKSKMAQSVKKQFLPSFIIGLSLIVGLIVLGYGEEYFWLSFVPSRIMFLGMGFTFFWLPHNHWHGEEELRQDTNFSKATSVRLGKEWILNPLLQYQNYHLIHHMWPTTPFYNNQKVWQLLEPELRQRDLVLSEGFKLYPEEVPHA